MINTNKETINLLKTELIKQREKWLAGEDNNYLHIFKICKDMGIVLDEDLQSELNDEMMYNKWEEER